MATDGSNSSVPKGFTLCHELSGPVHRIRRVAWSPDGKLIAAPTSGNRIWVWGPETEQHLRILEGHLGTVYSVAWAPVGRTLASGARDNTIRLWNTERWECFQILEGHGGRVYKVAWSPGDQQILASASVDTTIRLWETFWFQHWECTHVLSGHSGMVFDVAWSPDHRLLASGSADHTIRIWEAETGRERQRLEGHFDAIFSVAWSPDGQQLASAGSDHTIRIWDIDRGLPTHILTGHTQAVVSIDFSYDGQVLASKSRDDTVRLWRCDTWGLIATLAEPSADWGVRGLAFHPNDVVLATLGAEDKRVRIWHLNFQDLLSQPAEPALSATEEVYYYRSAKVALLGDTGVGKTALSLVLHGVPYQPTDSTHGRKLTVLTERKEIRLTGGEKEIRDIQLWDLAGQPTYRLINQLHLNDISLALVVFDARSEIDPFAGVEYWDRALRQAHRWDTSSEIPLTKFLVSARVDRGRVAASRERIKRYMDQYGFNRYFETSAREGIGIETVATAIQDSIVWESLTRVTSSRLFEKIKNFVIKEINTGQQLCLIEQFYQKFIDQSGFEEEKDTRSKFSLDMDRLVAANLIYKFSFGDLVLLKPELLDAYASAIVDAARGEPDGLGFIAEKDLKVGEGPLFLSTDERVKDERDEELLLIATVKELIRYEIAFKEDTAQGIILVFPAQLTRELISKSAPAFTGRDRVFTFEGPVPYIYATLAVRLTRSDFFIKNDIWKDTIEFRVQGHSGTCVIQLQELSEGQGEITVFFPQPINSFVKGLFRNYVRTHLQRKVPPQTLKERSVLHCPDQDCNIEIPDLLIQQAKNKKTKFMVCPLCQTPISLEDRKLEPEVREHTISSIDKAADQGREKDTYAEIIRGKRETGDYDIFLCYNNGDKSAVKEIGQHLIERGILPWLDEWDLRAGDNWLRTIEKKIETLKVVAVFIGPKGLGFWQEIEVKGFLNKYTEQRKEKATIIPVLLKGHKEIPMYLQTFQAVNFENPSLDRPPLESLILGIRPDQPPA